MISEEKDLIHLIQFIKSEQLINARYDHEIILAMRYFKALLTCIRNRSTVPTYVHGCLFLSVCFNLTYLYPSVWEAQRF